jgi:hypothetical protein
MRRGTRAPHCRWRRGREEIAALAEAQSIREVNKALAEARQNPLLYQLRAPKWNGRVDHWNGQYPRISSAQTKWTVANLLLQCRPRRDSFGYHIHPPLCEQYRDAADDINRN